MIRHLLLLLCLFYICGCRNQSSTTTDKIGADEITSFHSELRLMGDQSFILTETLALSIDGKGVKNGVARIFPLARTDQKKQSHPISYQVVRALHNDEVFQVNSGADSRDIIFFVGRDREELRPGAHRFWVQYTIKNGIDRQGDIDSLNWSITGPHLLLPIRLFSLEIFFPVGVPFSPANLALTARYQGKDQVISAVTEVTGEGKRRSLRAILPRQLRPREELIAKLRW